ncbi:MAG: DNA-3-methyladenine glycosylase [Phycisphaerales bacterium]
MPAASSKPHWIDPPADFVLARDYCSYGYFLLAPNHWDPPTQTFTRTLGLGAGGVVTVRVKQEGSEAGSGRVKPGAPLRVMSDRALRADERREITGLISRMLRLDEDAAHIRAFHFLDPRWKRSRGAVFDPDRARSGAGRGRLMRSPTFFEDVIKTVTSCNVTWPSTVNMNRRLCEQFGGRSESGQHGFPTASALARIRPAALRARCGVGYRDGRIVELARRFARGGKPGGIESAWYEDPRTPDSEIYDALLEWPGIGPYAAANIMQLLGRYSRLPLDTESLRHGKHVLGMKGSDRQIMKRLHEHFEPLGAHAFRSYWFELWTYYESKHGPAWTWVREQTAKAFTAAMLKEKPAQR